MKKTPKTIKTEAADGEASASERIDGINDTALFGDYLLSP